MGRMIKSRKEWVCGNCTAKYLTFAGTCKNCAAVGTIEEHILIPDTPRASAAQKAIMRRSKNSERNIAKRMVAADGEDPRFRGIATSTGRVGQITNMQFDAVSLTYVTEAKNRRIPTWMSKAWIQIQQRGIDFDKHALLHLEPPNSPKDFTVNGVKYKSDTMAVIRQDRHEQLIEQEKLVQAAINILVSDKKDAVLLYELRVLLNLLK